MSADVLYLLVEGEDDRRFLDRVIVPRLGERGFHVKIIQYAQKTHGYLENLLASLSAMHAKTGAEYAYLADIDDSPCVTEKKQRICSNLSGLEESRIFVVIKEIESWYLAGLTAEQARRMKVRRPPADTNAVTKETLNTLVPTRYSSRLEFMIDLLECYSLETAVQRNDSLLYFCAKMGII